VAVRAKYRGKKCLKTIDVETRSGGCVTDDVAGGDTADTSRVPPCPTTAGVAFFGQWGMAYLTIYLLLHKYN
jgi:hypothetical protein